MSDAAGTNPARLLEVLTQLVFIGYPHTIGGLRTLDQVAPAA